MTQEIADQLNMTEQEYWDMEEARDIEKWLTEKSKEVI